MASAPASSRDLLELVRRSGLVTADHLDSWIKSNRALPEQVHATAAKLVQDGMLTSFHAKHMLTGKYKGFVLGQYKMMDQIGAGGMGVIFLAEHLTMKRQVAIKVLPPDKASDPESLQRFYREARVVAALDHPNVVKAYDVDKAGDTHFMVMEFIDGESLEHMVRRRGPLPVEETANYIAQAARGLQHAHERNLVHRDIKPGNLLVDRTGTLKLLDMGLARFFEENSNLTTELCNGSVIGTADYMAPEQAVNSHDVDIRADIYSLGVTFYMLLTGQPPFASSNVAQKLLAHHMREPDPVQLVRPDVPDEVAAIVSKMMAKRPEDRYQTPQEVATALEPFAVSLINAASTATQTISETTVHRAKAATAKRQKWLWPAVAAAAVVLVGGIVILVGALSGPKSELSSSAKKPDEVEEQRPKQAVLPDRVRKKDSILPKVGQIDKFDTSDAQFERLALSPDEKWLVGGSRTGQLRVWNVESRKTYKEIKAHTDTIWQVAYAPKGNRLATACKDGSIKIWDTTDWKEQKKINVPKSGNMNAVWSVAFSPDGQTLFSGGDDGIARFWDANNGNHLRSCEKLSKAINWVAWSPTTNLVYTACWDGSVRAFDATSSAADQKFIYNGFEKDKRCVMIAVSPNGKLLLAGAENGLHLLNAETGVKIRNFNDGKFPTQWNAMFTGDGFHAISTGGDGPVRIWDVQTGSVFQTFVGHSDKVPGCVILKDGKTAITSSMDKSVRLWALPPRQ